MTRLSKSAIVLIGAAFLIIQSCKKKDVPPSVPTLATSEVTNIAATTATSGGTISNNGGTEIMAAGICWSKSNNNPTLTDDTTKNSVSGGAFVAEMKDLDPSATYYVRAYAINKAGTGYGNVVTFNTGNGAPEAKDVTVTGTAEEGSTLTGIYTYFDFESDTESGSTFQWYRANNASGEGEAAIFGATTLTYVLQSDDQGKYVRLGVTPKASSGTAAGAEVKSDFVGAIGEQTSVTFTYNGASVTYGIITSTVTGRKWLDRNLGAPIVPTAYNDFANYGDAFQWGRAADGHQLTTRAASSAGTIGVNGTTTTLSSSDNPGHALFIINSGDPADWRDPGNNNLWQDVNGINNPCPSGFRIPTKEEWAAENLSTLPEAYAQLKLTAGGYRIESSGSFFSTPSTGYYWTSSVANSATTPTDVTWATYQGVGSNAGQAVGVRATGRMCRCIKDN